MIRAMNQCSKIAVRVYTVAKVRGALIAVQPFGEIRSAALSIDLMRVGAGPNQTGSRVRQFGRSAPAAAGEARPDLPLRHP